MDNIYDNVKQTNFMKIQETGFSYDRSLITEKDTKYCQAIFSIFTEHNSHFTNEFYSLYQLLLSENKNGIVYTIDNQDYEKHGTLHFTFLQQLSFASFYDLSKKELDRHYQILKNILQLPIKIQFNRLIATPIGLIMCGDSDVNINELRDKYRKECKNNGLTIIEPHLNNIIHSTVLRFTQPVDTKIILDKFDHYLNNKIDYGYVILDHFNVGKGTLKINRNEILIDYVIRKNDTVDG